MKQKLSKLPSPALAGVVRERNVRAAIAEIKNCTYDGAAMIDLHMSCLEQTDVESLRKIIGSTKLPVLALNYNNTYDWGKAGFSEEERAQMFLRAVDAGAAGVDIQGYTYDLASKHAFCGEDKYSFTKGNPSEIVTDEEIISKQCDLIERVHAKGAEVLLSCHPKIPMTCEQVVDLALYLEKRNPDILKIVTVANNEDELLESFRTMLALKREVKIPVTYHAAGKAGTLSRILNPVLGGHIVFCVDRFTEASTIEQLDLKAAKSVIENVKHILGE